MSCAGSLLKVFGSAGVWSMLVSPHIQRQVRGETVDVALALTFVSLSLYL